MPSVQADDFELVSSGIIDAALLAASWELSRLCLARGGADMGIEGESKQERGAATAVEQLDVTQASECEVTGLAAVILSATTHPRTYLLLEMYRYTCMG